LNLESVSINELGIQEFGITCESTCFSLYDVVTWVVGTSQSTVTILSDSFTIKSESSDSSSKILEVTPEVSENSERSSRSGTGFGGGRALSAVSYGGDDSSEVSSSSSSNSHVSEYPVTSSSNAMRVLRGYYEAFNNHDIPAAVGFLSTDVKVKFPDPLKNWSQSSAAYDRYTTMFRKSPHLRGKFSLLDVVHERSRTTITVYCHFTCSLSGVDTVREMVYIIQDELICIIDNKY
jgi:hypothetical protein